MGRILLSDPLARVVKYGMAVGAVCGVVGIAGVVCGAVTWWTDRCVYLGTVLLLLYLVPAVAMLLGSRVLSEGRLWGYYVVVLAACMLPMLGAVLAGMARSPRAVLVMIMLHGAPAAVCLLAWPDVARLWRQERRRLRERGFEVILNRPTPVPPPPARTENRPSDQ